MASASQRKLEQIIQQVLVLQEEVETLRDEMKENLTGNIPGFVTKTFPTSMGVGSCAVSFSIKGYEQFAEGDIPHCRFTTTSRITIPAEYHKNTPAFEVSQSFVVNKEHEIKVTGTTLARNTHPHTDQYWWSRLKVRPAYFQKWWEKGLSDELFVIAQVAFADIQDPEGELRKQFAEQKKALDYQAEVSRLNSMAIRLKNAVTL